MTLTDHRLASLQEVALSYKGVPKAVRRYTWFLVHRARIHDEAPLRVPLPAIAGGHAEPAPRGDVAVVDVFPGRIDCHGGWRFRFGFHSIAAIAVLFLEE